MRLSEIEKVAGVLVDRDGEFHSIGFVNERRTKLLVFLESPRFLSAVRRNESVSAVITTPELANAIRPELGVASCRQPRVAFAKLHNELARCGFYWKNFPTAIDPAAQVHPTAWIAERNVRIGAGSIVEPHATVLERCLIGESVVVGAGVVLGGVGFQTVRCAAEKMEMKHAGGLLVHDRVRILPGAVIATGVFHQPTSIGEDTRIGANAFVSHAVQAGSSVFIGHGAVINGNVTIGDDTWIGPGAVISQSLHIGERGFVSLGAVVIRDLAAGARVSGNFALPHRRLMRMIAGFGSGRR